MGHRRSTWSAWSGGAFRAAVRTGLGGSLGAGLVGVGLLWWSSRMIQAQTPVGGTSATHAVTATSGVTLPESTATIQPRPLVVSDRAAVVPIDSGAAIAAMDTLPARYRMTPPWVAPTASEVRTVQRRAHAKMLARKEALAKQVQAPTAGVKP